MLAVIHFNRRRCIPWYATLLQLSPEAFLHPPNLMSYYRLIHIPHMAGGHLRGKEAVCDQGGPRGGGRARARQLRKRRVLGRLLSERTDAKIWTLEAAVENPLNEDGPACQILNTGGRIFSYFRPVQLAAAHSLVCRRWNAIATLIDFMKVPFACSTISQ